MKETLLYDLIDELECIIQDSIPIFPNYAIVNTKKINKIIKGIPLALTNEISDMHKLKRKKENILIEAREEANRIIREAKNKKDLY